MSLFRVFLVVLCIEHHNLQVVIIVVAALAMCPILTDPDNGVVDCSVEDGEVPTEGDTCIYICDEGFDPSGGEITRECLSDGNWSGNDVACDRGMRLFDELDRKSK